MADSHAAVAGETEHPHPNYMAVFWTLLALTILEVVVVYTNLSVAALISILLVMAFVKAGLVAWYFMHLKFDHRVLSVIAVVPLVLAAIAVGIISYEYSHYTVSDTATLKVATEAAETK
ncbi:MAG: cytochrome C oxidase subunit IV family protein [Bacteroidota bacterium]